MIAWLAGLSIHAPARGATSAAKQEDPTSNFQSTRPRGARPCDVWKRVWQNTFNPRAREGRDEPSDHTCLDC